MAQQQETATTEGHVAVLAFPFASHPSTLLAVINHLSTVCPNTHFSFFSTQKSNASIFTNNVNTHTIKPYNISEGLPEGYVQKGNPQVAVELFLKAAPGEIRRGLEAAESETGRPLSGFICDAFLIWFMNDCVVSDKFIDVPWFAFWTAGPCSLSAHFYTDLIRDEIAARGGETLNFIPGMSKIKVKYLPEGVVSRNSDSIFLDMIDMMGKILPRATSVFINCFEELDPEITNDLKTRFNNFLNIGPFNLFQAPRVCADEHGCIPWLDKKQHSSVAYISFGSTTTPPPHELVAIAEALEASKLPFIWSLKENARVQLPNGFIERTKLQGLAVPWAPQQEILSHNAVGVFMTHCGWNSLLESVGGGVPMICRPFFGDQRLNGSLIEDVWQIGLVVEGGLITKDGLIKCLDEVFGSDKGKKIKENVISLQEQAHKAVAPNGSSTRNLIALAELVSCPRNC